MLKIFEIILGKISLDLKSNAGWDKPKHLYAACKMPKTKSVDKMLGNKKIKET